MSLLTTRADPAMLGWLSDPSEAAVFAIADRLSLPLVLGLTAVNVVVAPLISRLHSEGKHVELQRTLTLGAVGVAVYTLPLAAGLIFFGPELLKWFGAGFEDAYGPLLWLILAQTVNALVGSVGYVLTMTGHQVVAAKILTACGGLKLAANYFLLPTYGALGAAFASAATLVVFNLALYTVVRRRLSLDTTLGAFLRGNR